MKHLAVLVIAAALAAPAGAGAQESYAGRASRRFDVEMNFGVGGYLGKVDEVTGAGPAYGVLAGWRRSPGVSYEFGYIGHSSAIEDAEGRLTSNKLQASVRAGPRLSSPIPWQPYAFGGLGANFVSAGTSGFGLTNAVQGVVPVGIGADLFTESPVRVGARGTYDWTPGIGSDVVAGAEHPDEWQATLTATASF